MFEKQGQHVLLLFVLLVGIYFLATGDVLSGQLWVIGFAFLSKAVLLAAAFNHLYIWVHFYFTELPDIRHIYGGQPKESA
jgi:hypothetical protein